MTNYLLVMFSCTYELRYWLFSIARIQLQYTRRYRKNKTNLLALKTEKIRNEKLKIEKKVRSLAPFLKEKIPKNY